MSKRAATPAPVPLLVPGPDTWELWDLAATPPRVTQAGLNPPTAADVPEGTTVLLPVHEVFTLPLWLAADEESLLPDMLRLQLERRGLAPKSNDLTLSHMVPVVRESARTLVRVTVLPSKFPSALCFTTAPRYEPVADALPFPEDSLVLWRELGRLVLAVTRGPVVLHAQALGDGNVTPDVVVELTCILTALEGQLVLGDLRRLVLWDALPREEVERLEHLTGLSAQRETRPAPQLGALRSGLTPAAVLAARQARTRSRQQRNIVKALVALYACLAVAAAGHLAWLKWQESTLTSSLQRDRPEVALATETAQRWKALEPSIEPANFPLEQLLSTATLLPNDGVRLTTFQQDQNGLLIEGEAQNAPAAFKFHDDIKARKELKAFAWNMGQPALLPNDSAKFRIEGKKGGARARLDR